MSDRKVRCIVTGSSYTFGKDYYEKKVKEYQDKETLKKYFITRKAKNYLYKGYSIQEIRNILNVTEEDLPGEDSQDIKDLIDYHKIQSSAHNKKISKTLNFATHKSDIEVSEFINTIRDYE
jgi:hypothetical protein